MFYLLSDISTLHCNIDGLSIKTAAKINTALLTALPRHAELRFDSDVICQEMFFYKIKTNRTKLLYKRLDSEMQSKFSICLLSLMRILSLNCKT